MKKLLLMTILAAAGCAKSDKPADKAAQQDEKLTFISVDDVDAHITKGTAQAVDANNPTTRQHEGVVPGAVLLTDSESFALTELPTDKAKELVFYCANTHCGASHQAASKAIAAGYTNVKVMPEGIAGWVKAGKKVQNI
ncbi:MAG TPA: rhodanese-like domain-containing protein [Kofleriaceae bacterium]|nr:rhodanese-like domain-containing protein [Kofleriaceae bacterium]